MIWLGVFSQTHTHADTSSFHSEIKKKHVADTVGEIQLTEEEFQHVASLLPAWAVSFEARTSKSKKLTFTSFVASPKIACLQSEFQHVASLLTAWAVSFDARTSKSKKLTFTSFVASPKIACLQSEWQSPKKGSRGGGDA
jgi:hypothetical protein